MHVTAVIPAHDADRFIAPAIESVLSQTHSDLTLVVVDDGSTDNTYAAATAAAAGDDRVVIMSIQNSGVAAARNLGAGRARRGAVAFLDADDTWFPKKLELQVADFEANTGTLVVGCLMRYCAVDGRALGVAGVPVATGDRERIAAGLFVPFPLSSTAYRTEIFRRLGGFDQSLDRVVPGQVEDLDLLARAAMHGSVSCVPEVLGTYTVHSAAASARSLASQRAGTRFVRERIIARSLGRDLTWDEFHHRYRPTVRQRHGDRVQAHYRSAGLAVAERRRGAAFRHSLTAALLGPRYTLRRARRQLGGSPT